MGNIDIIVKQVFKSKCKIDGVNKFRTLKVYVAGMELYAYAPVDFDYKAGMMLRVTRFSLTSCWTDFSTLGIVIEKFNVIENDEFKECKNVKVYIEGIIGWRGTKTLQKLGQSNKLFFSRVIKLNNKRGQDFKILLCGFGNLAEELYMLDDQSEVAISGLLRKSKNTAGYEVHIGSINKLFKPSSLESVKAHI